MNSYFDSVSIETKIAIAFYELGKEYEKRNCVDFAMENFRKALSYDPDLMDVKVYFQSLKEKHSSHKQSINTELLKAA